MHATGVFLNRSRGEKEGFRQTAEGRQGEWYRYRMAPDYHNFRGFNGSAN